MPQPDENQTQFKFGLFYYNKTDSRVWVPKQNGLGWTLNFANPRSYLMLAGLIGTIIYMDKIALHQK